MSAEARLTELQIALPPAPKPVGLYKPMFIVGDLAYLSGHGPLNPDGTLHLGRVVMTCLWNKAKRLPVKRDWPCSQLCDRV